MPRLFTALELPEDIRDDLADLEMPIPGARFVDTDDLHVTLRFAGDVDNRTANEFADALASIDGEAFITRIAGLGVFGGREAKSIHATVEAGPALERLARANERAARAAGLAPETRAFKPHVTIARLRNPRAEALARFLSRHGAYSSEPFLITHFALISSKPMVGGGPYVVEETYPLAEVSRRSGLAGPA
ncbi:MAG: RNA 2',3'-cyclic phosphodiesterase [Hyphomicrobiaceae bacterium]|nr:RNA 2',3'-cyclic phosphodiesterase [Hyphomicrobiaceae bacterium]